MTSVQNPAVDAAASQEAEIPEPRQPALELRPVRVEKTFVSVANEIKRLIFSGVLKPGDRLPSELELAERLGVSRPSVREALRVLELSGFLQVQRGGAGGRVIVDTISASIGNSLLDAVQLSNVTTAELTTARIVFETSVVREAALHAGEDDLAALRQNIETAYRNIALERWAADDNIEFHKLLAKAAKNHVLSILLEALLRIFTESMDRLQMVPRTHKSREFTRQHEGILEAIVSRDPDLAARRMEAHLREVSQKLHEPSQSQA